VSTALIASCLDAAARSFSTCPVALSEDVLAPPFFWRVPLDEAERRFASCEYGVYCAGNAWHLVQTFAAEGLEAFTFNFAVDLDVEGSTHVIVLVRLGGDTIALDPYYGHYLVEGETGAPLSFGSHLEELRSPGAGTAGGRWARLPAAGDKRLLLGDPATIGPPGGDWLRRRDVSVERLHAGRLVLRHPSPPSWIESLSLRSGTPNETAYERGLLRPLNIGDSSGQSTSLPLGDVAGISAASLLANEFGLGDSREDVSSRRAVEVRNA
jgi:hypothetical protein